MKAIRHSLDETVGSTPEAVRQALVRVSRSLGRHGVGTEDLGTVELVLAESMNNVVEHAFCEQPGSHFRLKLKLAAESLHCEIEDEGEPMPGLDPPPGRLHDLSVGLEDLPEGGFGWFLIRELTTGMRYVRVEQKNSLSFHIPLSPSG